MAYQFLSTGRISADDIERIVHCTVEGHLRWYSPGVASSIYKAQPYFQEPIQAFLIPAHRQAATERVGSNLREIRLETEAGEWSMLRLKAGDGTMVFASRDATPELAESLDWLWLWVSKAMRFRGLLKSVNYPRRVCPTCGTQTPHMPEASLLICVGCETVREKKSPIWEDIIHATDVSQR